jgi:ipoprotein LpqH
VKRGLIVAVSGTALVVAGLTGCSSDKNKDEHASSASSATASATMSATASATASASEAAPGGGSATSGTGTAKVTVDGKAQDVSGTIACTTMGGNTVIAIGNAGGSGLGATLTDTDPPEVKAVGLGSVGGHALAYAPGVPGSEAKATKDGKTYKISGTIMSVDMSNPMAPSNKPFEMEVTCP